MSVSTVAAYETVTHALRPKEWPLRCVTPPATALAQSPGFARTAVVDALRHWGLLDEFKDDAELIVSELVTNVLQHTRDDRSAQFQVFLFTDRQRLVIAVWDNVTDLPHKHSADDDDETGRGLVLCDVLGILDWFKVDDGKVVRVWLTAGAGDEAEEDKAEGDEPDGDKPDGDETCPPTT